MKSEIRPPVKWHGGKYYLCQKIIPLFPEHETYLEPFGGGASVLLNKQPSQVEIYNDIDERITRLFRVIRDEGKELVKLLSLTPYSESEFERCATYDPSDSEVEKARKDFVRWRMSIGGRGKGFSFSKHRSRRGMADVVSGFLSSIDSELPKICERLRTVQIMQRNAIELIEEWDGENVLIYCDPPYVHSSREKRSTNVYGNEMSDAEHKQLGEVLNGCKAKVVLSGYATDLYNDLFSDWTRLEIQISNHSSSKKTKEKKVEVVWTNFSIRDSGKQLLFET
ncbi:DNA adenine methylase [Rubripirellula sp.]|nr:DNA adenine methylase [Rubripirellula sp.]MDB4634527.1 DNA adenine methylase [Rubripirellula sp.]